ENQAGIAIIQYGYDGLGNVVKVTDARGAIAYNYYDRVGNLTTACADATGFKYVTENVYNGFGEGVAVTQRYNSASNLTSEQVPPTVTADSVHDAVSFKYYDALGRLVKSCDALKFVTQTTYTVCGEVASVTRYYNAANNTPSITVQPT